jgi:zinc protease
MQLMAELLQKPRFAADEFDQLRAATVSSLETQKSDPSAVAGNAVAQHYNLFPRGHWLSYRAPDEQIADVKEVSLEAMRRCHQQFAGAQSALLSVVGDFKPETAKALIAQLFGQWQSPVAYRRIAVPLPDKPALVTEIKTPDKANAVLRASLPIALQDTDPDYPALAVANYLIGGNAAARLPNRVREKEGLSYSTYSFLSVSSLEKEARFSVASIYAPENRAKVEAAIREELQKVVNEGFTQTEIKEAVESILQSRRQSRASDGALASKLAGDLFLGRTYAWDAALEEQFKALTAASVNAAIKRNMDLSKLTLVKAGDFK